MQKITDELIKSLKNPEERVLFVIGPYVGDYKLVSPEEAELFKLKGIAKEPEKFFSVLTDKILTPCDDLKTILASFDKHVDKYYAQSVNGLLGPNMVYLKGDASQLECTGCHKKYAFDDIPEHLECACNKLVRPKCLLTSEQYNVSILDAFEKDVKNASVVFLIGFDFNEIELCKQLEIIAAEKLSGGKGPTIIVIGECDAPSIYETFRPTFIIDKKPEGTLKDLLDIMEGKS